MRESVLSRLSNYFRNKEIRSAGILFILNALLFSNLALCLPQIKATLGIDDLKLGNALILPAMGVILGAPFISILMNRWGTGKVASISVIGMAASYGCTFFVDTYLGFCVFLFAMGIFNGGLDIGMNGVVSALEKKHNKVLMSTSHGLWSTGSMVGSMIGGGMLLWGLTYGLHLLLVSGTVILIALFLVRTLWPIRDKTESNFKWVWPGKTLFLLIFIIFTIFIVEGAIMEWNAIYYKEILNAPEAMIGIGFTGFGLSMAICRFMGDQWIERYDKKTLLTFLLGICMVGILIYANSSSMVLCTVAMIIAGIGCSLIVPIVFYYAGASKRVNPSTGLALISTLGYAGFLVGPPLIGFLSHNYSLRISFITLALFLLLAMAAGFRISRSQTQD